MKINVLVLAEKKVLDEAKRIIKELEVKCEYLTTKTAEEAIEILQTNDIQLAIIDADEKNAIWLIKEIYNYDKNIRLITLGSQSEDQFRRSLLEDDIDLPIS